MVLGAQPGTGEDRTLQGPRGFQVLSQIPANLGGCLFTDVAWPIADVDTVVARYYTHMHGAHW